MDEQKKRRKKLLFYGFEQDQNVTSKILIEKMKIFFKSHIGKENAVSPVALFERIIGKNPQYLNIYEKMFYWKWINQMISRMRTSNELFIINEGNKLYVLQTLEEANYYKRRADGAIKGLKHNKKNADLWVKNKKWMDFLEEKTLDQEKQNA